MAKPTKSIALRLIDAQRAINNTLSNSVILDAVAIFGYDQARMEAARALHDEAQELAYLQGRAYGKQYEATQIVQQVWKEAQLAYSATLKISRVVFRDSKEAQIALGLSGSRKQSLSGWLDQARGFYNNMLQSPDLMAAMAPYSYDPIKLEAEAALVQAVVEASDTQDRERGKAQEATLARDVKLEELDRWMADYKAIAQVALSDSPQRMEQLGWVVKS